MIVLRIGKTRRLLHIIIAILLIQAVLLVPAVWGGTMGRASVIDGDTIEMHGQRIRLYGIDAPESHQACRKDGRPWRCGQQAALMLDKLIIGKIIRCVEKDHDRYGRLVGECFAGDLIELVASFMERSSFSHWPRCGRQWHTRAVQSEKCVGLHGRA